MSNTIENRVVEMKFDNKDFEKNIKISLKSLEDLKKGLDLDKSAQSLGVLEKAVGSFDFGRLGEYVDTAMNRLSMLGRVGEEAMNRISNAAVNAGQALVRELGTAPVSEGFSKYETQIGSLQTILYATGKPLDEVKGVLGELQKYSDNTSYSLTDMTSSLAQMMNTLGPDRLDDAVVAIKGIDNLAAAAGRTSVEAQRAQYNIGQAMSVGYMQKLDWKSIENAGMATMEFKEQILEAAVAEGKLKKTSKGLYYTNVKGQKKVQVTAKNLSETLKYQWMTTDVMLNVLGQYGDETTEVGKKAYQAAKETKTFAEMMNYLKDSVSSGWMQTFEYVIGDYQEAKDMWTALADEYIGPIFDEMTEKRNEMFKAWHENGGRMQLLEGFDNIWQTIERIAGVIDEAWKSVFPEMTWKQLLTWSDAFRDWSIKLNEFFSETTPEGKRRLDNISSAVEGFAKVIDGLMKFFGPLVSIFGDFIASLADPALELLGFLGEELGNIGEGLSTGQFFTALTDSLLLLFNYISQNAPAIVASLQDFWGKLTEWFNQSGIVEDVSNALLTIANVLIATIPTIVYYAGELFNFLWEVFQSIDFEKIGEDLNKTFKPVKDFLDQFGGVIKNALDRSIAVDTSGITDPLEKIKAKLAPFKVIFMWLEGQIRLALNKLFQKYPAFLTIWSSIQTFLANIGSFFAQFKLDNVKAKIEEIKNLFADLKDGGFEKFGEFKEGLFGKFNELLGSLGTVGEEIKKHINDFPTWAKEKFKSIGTTIADIIKWCVENLPIDAVLKIAKGIATIRALWGLGDALSGLGSFLKDKGDDSGDFGDIVLKIAFSLAIVVGCLYAIAAMDTGDIIKAGFVLGVIAAALVGLASVMNEVTGGKGSGILEIGGGILALAVGLMLLKGALTSYAKMDPGELERGLEALGGILIRIAIFNKLSGGGNGGFNFLGLSIGLMLLMVPLKQLAGMGASELNKGVKAISVLMIIMGVASRLAGGAGSLGSAIAFIGMAAALDIIIPMINTLAQMDAKDVKKSVGGIVALLLSFGVMMRLASKMSFGSALGIIGVMAVSMLSITYGLTEIIKSGANPDEIIKFSTAFSEIIIAMGAAVLLMGGQDATWTSGAKAAVNLGEFIVVLGGVLAALGASMEICPGVWDLVSKGGDALELIGEALGKAIGGLIKGIFGSNTLESFQKDLTKMGDTLNGFATQMDGFQLSSIMEAVNAMKELGMAAAAIPASGGLIQKVVGEHDVGQFAEDLPKLGNGLKEFSDKVKDLDTDKVSAAAAAGKLLAELNAELPPTGGKLQEWIGQPNLNAFSTQLGPLGLGIRLFGKLVKEVNTDQVTAAASAAKILAQLNAELPPTGGTLQKWLGKKELGQFAANLAPLGRGIKSFADEVKGVSADAVTKAANAAKTLAELAHGIPLQGGGLSYLIGDHELDKFGQTLAPLGEGISTFATNIKGVNTDSVTKAASAAKVLGELANAIPAQGGWINEYILGEKSLAQFSEDLPGLATGLVGFTTNLQGIQPDAATQAIGLLNEIVKGKDDVSFLSSMQLDYNGIFGTNLDTIGEGISKFSSNVSSVNVVQASAAIGIVSSLGTMLKTFDNKSLPKNAEYAAKSIKTLVNDSEFMGAVTTMASSFIRGLDTALQSETMPGSTTMSLASELGGGIVETINDFYDQAYKAGANLMAGLRRGIEQNMGGIYSATGAAAERGMAGITETTEEHSPSKVFYRYGAYWMEGLRNGVRDYSNIVEKQTTDVAENVTVLAEDALDMISYLMSTDPSMSPVITPVFDMSNYRRGIDALDTSRLNGRLTLGGYSSQLGYDVMSTSPGQIVDTIIGMSEQINSLGEAIQQMQVVMDTGALVGQIAGEMDKRLGMRAVAQARRG